MAPDAGASEWRLRCSNSSLEMPAKEACGLAGETPTRKTQLRGCHYCATTLTACLTAS